MIGGKRVNCFCAFCKTPRRIPKSRHVSLSYLVLAAVFSFFLMYALWGGMEGRVLIIYSCLVGLGEVMAQVRWRLSLACSECGFDPILYLKSPERAAERVKAFLDTKREAPLGLLSMPDLPAVVKTEAIREQIEGSEVGREPEIEV